MTEANETPDANPADEEASAAASQGGEEEEASPELIAAQEEALQLELNIYEEGPDGLEHELDVLLQMIADRKVALKKEHEAEEKEASSARATAKKAKAAERAAQKKVDDAMRSSTTVEMKSTSDLGTPNKADKALAKKHGYPVVIPGAKAYRTKLSFHCAYGGKFRQMGSIVLLTDAHAANKKEYLTAIK